MGRISQARWLLAALLVASTALFAVGVSLERSRADTHAEVRSSSEVSGGRHAGESDEASETAESGDAGKAGESSEGERIAGVDSESDGLLAIAIAVGLALAAAMLTRAGEAPWFLLAVAAVAIVWALLDVREIVHQLDESQAAIAVVAAGVAALHGTVGVLSVREARRVRVSS
jgi:hypothetical protein